MATHSSVLENPRDGGAWWEAVYGVVQSRTRLKRLSSSINKALKICIFLHKTKILFRKLFSNLRKMLLKC